MATDSQFFRVRTDPDYYKGVDQFESRSTAYRTVLAEKNTVTTPDNRFPGWAAPMTDGRLITDYRPHCAGNIPAGKQFATKGWIQNNSEDIIRVSRERQAKQNGATLGLDMTTVPPPANVVKCEATQCWIAPTGLPNGIGTDRSYDKAPELFGTFSYNSTGPVRPSRLGLTTQFEGGRNSPRGREFKPIGSGYVKA
jgi:hypothetical protein